MVTFILSIAGCILLFLAIWIATVTMPFKMLVINFPEDVQECLKPRLDSQKMDGKRVIGGIITVIFLLGCLSVWIIGGMDGVRHNFSFGQFFLRFFIMGALTKAFDIICLDYFLLTKTHFFQHYLPETEGCAGWKQFGYNRKQQLRQCIMIPIFCLILALVFSFVF